MTLMTVRRPARRIVPDPGSGSFDLAAPPQLPETASVSGSVGMIAVPAASGAGAVLLALTQRDRPLLAAAGLLVLLASVAVGAVMLIGTRTGARRRQRIGRERYLDYLEQVRRQAVRSRSLQWRRDGLAHPHPRQAAARARDPVRRWERRPSDRDFLLLRTGIGTIPLDRPVPMPVWAHDPTAAYDPVCLAAAADLAAGYQQLGDQPVCLPFGEEGTIAMLGGAEETRAVARALVAQLIAAHSPDDVAVLVLAPGEPARWDLLKWLPHAQSSGQFDGPLPARLITVDPEPAGELIRAEVAAGSALGPPKRRRLVVIIDAHPRPGAGDQCEVDRFSRLLTDIGCCQLHLVPRPEDEPPTVGVRITVGGASTGRADLVEFLARGADPEGPASIGCALDRFDEIEALAMARAFAPLRPPPQNARVQSGDAGLSVPVGDPAGGEPPRGRPPGSRDLLCAPIGTDVLGEPVVLDLKEAARGGHGPHGLVVGATGSGKSELLRTLVVALAARHSPESLALLLVDFKGGATFSEFVRLPQVVGMITNLQVGAAMVDRFRLALGGELHRRQEMLAAAGNLSSQHEYTTLRIHRPDLQPMPHLLVIVDEFSELLGARPELADLFVTIGRIGRSIGIHLLLATQRLDTGRLRGLESHLSYRICLRTFSEAESREAIGTADAYRLSSDPGGAFLRTDGPGLRRFRVTTVSQPFRPEPPVNTDAMVLPFPAVNGLVRRAVDLRGRSSGSQTCDDDRSVLQLAVDRLIGDGTGGVRSEPARRIWLDPLPECLGWRDIPVQTVASDSIGAAFGMVDLPEQQAQRPLIWDCTSGNANLLIVGSGRSGKSTAVRSLLVSLCHRHPPGAVAVYCVDYGGEELARLDVLPQVAVVAGRVDAGLTRKVFTRLAAMLDAREALLRSRRQGSGPATFRGLDGVGGPAVPADVLLVIDGWASVRDAVPEVESALEQIISRGPGLGVHTVLTVGSPGQLRSRLLAGFAHRIELRLTDSFDSVIDRRLAAELPADLPGRALVAGRHVAQIAWPEPAETTAAEALPELRHRWPAPPVPRLRSLPALVRIDDLLAESPPTASSGRLLIGLADDDLAPLYVDLSDDPHLLIYGETRSGRSMLLLSLLTQLTTAAEAVDVRLIDVRGRLPAATPAGARIATGALPAARLCTELATELAGRLESIRSGRRLTSTRPIFLLVDDYEMVGGRTTSDQVNPLLPLVPYLAHAGELDWHLVLARHTGGAGRAQFETLLQILGEGGTPAVLLSGPAAEGRLAHGTGCVALPPGRALFVTRSAAPQLIQTPWVPTSS